MTGHAGGLPDQQRLERHPYVTFDTTRLPDTILTCGGEAQICFGQHRRETFLGSGCYGRRHDQEEDRQGLWVYRHWERRGHIFSLVKLRRELRRAPRRTTSVIHRRKWTKRAKSRKRQSGLRLKRFKAKEADEFSSASCIVTTTDLLDNLVRAFEVAKDFKASFLFIPFPARLPAS